MNKAPATPKRNLPTSDPTGETPPRKILMRGKFDTMDLVGEGEDDTEMPVATPTTTRAKSRALRRQLEETIGNSKADKTGNDTQTKNTTTKKQKTQKKHKNKTNKKNDDEESKEEEKTGDKLEDVNEEDNDTGNAGDGHNEEEKEQEDDADEKNDTAPSQEDVEESKKKENEDNEDSDDESDDEEESVQEQDADINDESNNEEGGKDKSENTPKIDNATTDPKDMNPRSGAEIQTGVTAAITDTQVDKMGEDEQNEDVEKDKKSDDGEDEQYEDVEKDKKSDDENNTNPRLGAEIQAEANQQALVQLEDTSVEIIDPPTKLTIENLSFQILQDRSRGQTTLIGDTGGGEADSYELIRLFVCTEIRDFQGRDEFHERFIESVNEFFKLIMKIEPGARMIPWESKHVNLVKGKTALPPVQNKYKKYMHFRMKYATQGKKFLRLNVAFPTKGDILYVLEQIEENSDWWEDQHHYANISPCQGITPVIIGWFSRSLESMTQADEFQVVLRQLIDDPSLGLVWQAINRNGKSRVTLDGTVRDTEPVKKTKGGKKIWEKPVKAAHVEVDVTNENRSCARLASLYNNNADKSYPLGYSLYFVQDLRFRAMLTSEGRQGYIKAWHHQKNLLSFLYNEFCNIINIDAPVPLNLGLGNLTFRKFLTNLKVAATPGVEGDKLFVSITRTASEGMEFCFTYHALAVNEAEEVTRNLPLLYEHEFGGNPSDFFEYDLRQQLTGYKWDKDLRQASSPEGAALFRYGSEMCEDKEENELTIDNINPLELVTYKRLQGDCDETVFNGVDNSGNRANQLKNKSTPPPDTVKANGPGKDTDEESRMSDLTSTPSQATVQTGGTIHTMRSDGSMGTKKSRVAKEVNKAKKKAAKAQKKLEDDKNKEIEELRNQLAMAQMGTSSDAQMQASDTGEAPAQETLPAMSNPTSPILLNRDASSTGRLAHSGRSPVWDPLFNAERAAQAAEKKAAHLMQKAKALAVEREQKNMQNAQNQDPSSVSLPSIPDRTACQYDVLTQRYIPHYCSFCHVVLTSNRCTTLMPDSEPHYFIAGEARCARAFCASCSSALAVGDFDPTSRTTTCPFHLLQGRHSDSIAGAGLNDKILLDDSLPAHHSNASSDEPDPSSNGVMQS